MRKLSVSVEVGDFHLEVIKPHWLFAKTGRVLGQACLVVKQAGLPVPCEAVAPVEDFISRHGMRVTHSWVEDDDSMMWAQARWSVYDAAGETEDLEHEARDVIDGFIMDEAERQMDEEAS